MEPDALTAARNDYPNIHAIATDTISGRFSEWPRVKPEAVAILAELSKVRGAIAQLKAQVTHDPATCHVCLGGVMGQ